MSTSASSMFASVHSLECVRGTSVETHVAICAKRSFDSSFSRPDFAASATTVVLDAHALGRIQAVGLASFEGRSQGVRCEVQVVVVKLVGSPTGLPFPPTCWEELKVALCWCCQGQFAIDLNAIMFQWGGRSTSGRRSAPTRRPRAEKHAGGVCVAFLLTALTIEACEALEESRLIAAVLIAWAVVELKRVWHCRQACNRSCASSCSHSGGAHHSCKDRDGVTSK
mmetsp:Transcript_96829/g.172296  ORF Transcript_96829/g.172296 Transcript_96829/m.172296 type:complete len:225 (+) Transcript_96829:363-1037(+)